MYQTYGLGTVITSVLVAATLLGGCSGAPPVPRSPAPAGAVPTRVAAGTPCPSRWAEVPVPSPLLNGHVQSRKLYALAAVGPADVWTTGPSNGDPTHLDHWDGRAWTAYPIPRRNSVFRSLAAHTTTDVWAAGEAFNGPHPQTLIAHWDGHAWTQVPSPAPDASYSEFDGIAAFATADAWAVGTVVTATTGSMTSSGLLAHWDGQTWRGVPAPAGAGVFSLNAVAGSAADDVWAVGTATRGAVTLHWDGHTWQVVPVPTGAPTAELRHIAVRGRAEAWTVGYTVSHQTNSTQPLILHWDGRAWQETASPDPGPGSSLAAVAVAPDGTAWAGGSRGRDPSGYALLEYWDGHTWHLVTPPPLAQRQEEAGVRALAATQDAIWAVANQTSTDRLVPLVIRYAPACGAAPSPTVPHAVPRPPGSGSRPDRARPNGPRSAPDRATAALR